jgi:hypothetical protein
MLPMIALAGSEIGLRVWLSGHDEAREATHEAEPSAACPDPLREFLNDRSEPLAIRRSIPEKSAANQSARALTGSPSSWLGLNCLRGELVGGDGTLMSGE